MKITGIGLNLSDIVWEMETPEESKKNNEDISAYSKYSALAYQVIGPVAGGVIGGRLLDNYLDKKTPIFTIIFSSLMIVVALYNLIKQGSKN